MATIQLTISTKLNKQIGKSEILLRFFHGKINLRTKTGLFIKPERWNKDKECLIIPRYATPEQIELIEIQNKIDELKNLIVNSFFSTNKIEINNKWLDSLIDNFCNLSKNNPTKIEEIKEVTLLRYVNEFIIQSHNRKNKETGRILSKNNIQQYKATQKHLEFFTKLSNKVDFKFSEINNKFYDNFVTYLQNPIPKMEKGKNVFDNNGNLVLIKKSFTQNSVGKHIKILKVMLNEAPNELIAQSNYKKFRVFTEDVDNIYLNETELNELKKADFSKLPHLDHVRDWFLLLSWTGCRFSDLEKIGKSDIREKKITFRQQKTGNKITIPLHPVVFEILNKYNYKLPNSISNQKFNEYIKIVVKDAGIVQLESISRTRAGKLITVQLPKYELVSSHTGRRSFATNMYKQGIPSLTIMSVTGHKMEKSFLKYIKVKQSEHAEIMAAAWKKIY